MKKITILLVILFLVGTVIAEERAVEEKTTAKASAIKKENEDLVKTSPGGELWEVQAESKTEPNPQPQLQMGVMNEKGSPAEDVWNDTQSRRRHSSRAPSSGDDIWDDISDSAGNDIWDDGDDDTPNNRLNN